MRVHLFIRTCKYYSVLHSEYYSDETDLLWRSAGVFLIIKLNNNSSSEYGSVISMTDNLMYLPYEICHESDDLKQALSDLF